MTATKHTQGPWQVFQKWPGYHGIEIRSGDISIADLRVNGHNAVHGEANARLIAAAPEMLEALQAQEMADYDPEASERKGYFERAKQLRKAALAKAEGRS